MRQYDRDLIAHVCGDPTKRDAVLLASYPKSGNTYLRFIFANILALQELDGRVVDYTVLDSSLPTDQFRQDLLSPWPFRTLPCLLKTHHRHRDVFQRFRRVFLYRHPFDTMVSAYEYFRRRVAPQPFGAPGERLALQPYGGTLREFVRERFDGWCAHFLSWHGRANATVRYQTLRNDPVTTMERLIDRLDLRVDGRVLAEAVARSSFDRVRQLEDERGKSEKMARLDGRFARSGRVGQWRERFSSEDLDYMRGRLFEYRIFEFEGSQPDHPAASLEH